MTLTLARLTEIEQRAAALDRHGLTSALNNLTGHAAAEIRAHFAPLPTYAGHVVAQSDGIGRTAAETQATGSPHACYTMAATLRAPHLLRHALDHLDVAAEYLDCEPVLYSLNTWQSFPTGPSHRYTQQWHRDHDDKRFLALFTFLSDVGQDGAHLYVNNSHRTTEDRPKDDAAVVNTFGSAGASFIADTSGLHMGGKPVSGVRWITWARFGVSERPKAYVQDRLEPVEIEAGWMNERQRRACRLILR